MEIINNEKDREYTKQKLITAVGVVINRDGFEKGLFKSIFLRSQGGLYEQKFVIIHERSVS